VIRNSVSESIEFDSSPLSQTITTKGFHSIPQFFQANIRILSYNKLRQSPSTSSAIHLSQLFSHSTLNKACSRRSVIKQTKELRKRCCVH